MRILKWGVRIRGSSSELLNRYGGFPPVLFLHFSEGRVDESEKKIINEVVTRVSGVQYYRKKVTSTLYVALPRGEPTRVAVASLNTYSLCFAV